MLGGVDLPDYGKAHRISGREGCEVSKVPHIKIERFCNRAFPILEAEERGAAVELESWPSFRRLRLGWLYE